MVCDEVCFPLPFPSVYCFSLTADLVIFYYITEVHSWRRNYDQGQNPVWLRWCAMHQCNTPIIPFHFGSLCCKNCVGARRSTKTHLVYSRCNSKPIYCCSLEKLGGFYKENKCFTLFCKLSKKYKWCPFLPRAMSLSGFMHSVMELVRFVGLLASEGLRLENCHILLLNQTLDFYETVLHSAMINLINVMSLAKWHQPKSLLH